MPFLTLLTSNWKLILIGLIIAYIGVLKYENLSLKGDIKDLEHSIEVQNAAIKVEQERTKAAIEAGKKAQEEAEVKKQESEELKRKLRSFPTTGNELNDAKKLIKDYKKGAL